MYPRHRRLLRGERLIIMAVTEQMEWHGPPGNHAFDVFDTFLSFRSTMNSELNVEPSQIAI